MKYTRKAISIFKSYLPAAIADQVSKQARETYALSALDMAYSLLTKGDIKAALVQIREALQFSFSARVVRRAIRLVKQVLLHQVKNDTQKKIE